MSVVAAAAIAHTVRFVSAEVEASSAQNGTTNGRVGWVSSPSGRHSMSIIWSCLTVLFVCTYRCLHLNISSFEENRAGWHTIKLFGIPYWPERALLRKCFRKIKWMLLILLAPEYGVAMAVAQYQDAKSSLNKAREQFPHVELSMVHAFYAQMGGFAAEIPVAEADTSQRLVKLSLTEYLSLCLELEKPCAIVSTESLEDRSKSDAFTRIFAIVQCFWLITQCIARVSAGLQITELELATMAYVVCAVIMNAYWWYKPFDAEHVTVIHGALRNSFSLLQRRDWKRVGNDYDHWLWPLDLSPKGQPSMAFLGTGVIFSAIHLAAWNWEFGHAVARWLWRGSALAATVIPVLCPGIALGLDVSDTINIIVVPSMLLLIFSYVVARLLLLGLVAFCFTSMPASAYTGIEWTNYFPHFS